MIAKPYLKWRQDLTQAPNTNILPGQRSDMTYIECHLVRTTSPCAGWKQRWLVASIPRADISRESFPASVRMGGDYMSCTPAWSKKLNRRSCLLVNVKFPNVRLRLGKHCFFKNGLIESALSCHPPG